MGRDIIPGPDNQTIDGGMYLSNPERPWTMRSGLRAKDPTGRWGTTSEFRAGPSARTLSGRPRSPGRLPLEMGDEGKPRPAPAKLGDVSWVVGEDRPG